MGTPSDEARVEAMREHWERRYTLPQYVPLDDPHPGFLDWITSHDDDRPPLGIGDGEGRNARAVPGRHPVTMVELSAAGADLCRSRTTRPLEVVVGDAFAWLPTQTRRWPLVGMLYLGPLVGREVDVLAARLRDAQRLGGGFFLENARPGLPLPMQERLLRQVEAVVTDVSRDDGVERVRIVG